MKKGFTLVELLIVITIIGILAAVIVPRLNNARVLGADAKIKSEVDSLQKTAAFENNLAMTYEIVCGSALVTQNAKIAEIISSIEASSDGSVACNSSTGRYAVSVPISSGHWCVDSAGAKKEIPNPLVETTGSEEFACP